jgi:hypothetical protein
VQAERLGVYWLGTESQNGNSGKEVRFMLKRSILILTVGLAAALLASASTVGFSPGVPCVDVVGNDIPCTAAPSTTALTSSNDPLFVLPSDPGLVHLPIFVVPGDVVLFETSPGSLNNQLTWSDVVEFFNVRNPTGGFVQGSFAQTFPDAEPVGILLPPGFTLSLNAVGLPETTTGVGSDAVDFTTYTAGSAAYQIHSDAALNPEPPEPTESTPEPATSGLLGLGLGGLFLLGKLRGR